MSLLDQVLRVVDRFRQQVQFFGMLAQVPLSSALKFLVCAFGRTCLHPNTANLAHGLIRGRLAKTLRLGGHTGLRPSVFLVQEPVIAKLVDLETHRGTGFFKNRPSVGVSAHKAVHRVIATFPVRGCSVVQPVFALHDHFAAFAHRAADGVERVSHHVDRADRLWSTHVNVIIILSEFIG